MRPFKDCSKLTDFELREHAKTQGYIYMKNFLDIPDNIKMKNTILKYCEEYGCIEPGTEKYIKGTSVDVIKGGVGPEEYFKKIIHDESFYIYCQNKKIKKLIEMIEGEEMFLLPNHIVRTIPPIDYLTTLPHQDYWYWKSTLRGWTFWIPLGDVPMEKGALLISPGSNLKGPAHDDERYYDKEAGMLTFNPGDVEFIGNDFSSGDFIAFQCQTIHKVTKNTTEDIRLSIDIRYQPKSDPVNKFTLFPHTRISEWSDIYKNFVEYDQKYYWEKMNLTIGEYDGYNLLKNATSFD